MTDTCQTKQLTFSILLLACGPEKANNFRGTIQFKSPFSTFYSNITMNLFTGRRHAILLRSVRIRQDRNFRNQRNREVWPRNFFNKQ